MERVITGHTRVYGIIADPVAHVRTPQALNALMRAHGVDGAMVPMHVTAANARAFLDGLRRWENFGGFIATVPHKTAMISLCDRVSERAKLVGAANAVRREADGSLVGDILDGDGFVGGLREAGVEPRGRAVFLAGAGGAARAIAFALAEAGVARLTIHNRSARNAEQLASRVLAAHPAISVAIAGPDPAGHDIIVNATSLGLAPDDALPLVVGGLTPDMTVAEIIMEPETTRLLAEAKKRGCRIHPGMPMLAAQLPAMARFLRMID